MKTGEAPFRKWCGMRDVRFFIRMSDNNDHPDEGGPDSGVQVLEKTQTKTANRRPSRYRVLLLNDDYTPMEFVVHVLERYFHKNRDEATSIMLSVHHEGVGVCGVYPYDVAETKMLLVMELARQHQHPLQCVMERE